MGAGGIKLGVLFCSLDLLIGILVGEGHKEQLKDVRANSGDGWLKIKSGKKGKWLCFTWSQASELQPDLVEV